MRSLEAPNRKGNAAHHGENLESEVLPACERSVYNLEAASGGGLTLSDMLAIDCIS